MKADFYYKEEFPLELHIKIENIADLALLNAVFYNIVDGVNAWAVYMGVKVPSPDGRHLADKDGKTDVSAIKEQLTEECKEILTQVTEVYANQRKKVEENDG